MLAGMFPFRSGRPGHGRQILSPRGWLVPTGAVLSLAVGVLPVRAQVETFTLQRGSNIGPETRVTPTNCVSGSDGSVRCDTQIINPPSSSPAKPQFQPFKN